MGNHASRTRIASDPADDKTDERAWDCRNRLTGVALKNNGGAGAKGVGFVCDVIPSAALNRPHFLYQGL